MSIVSIILLLIHELYLNSKVRGANMGPIWGRQDPGGPNVGPMNFAIWVAYDFYIVKYADIHIYFYHTSVVLDLGHSDQQCGLWAAPVLILFCRFVKMWC